MAIILLAVGNVPVDILFIFTGMSVVRVYELLRLYYVLKIKGNQTEN